MGQAVFGRNEHIIFPTSIQRIFCSSAANAVCKSLGMLAHPTSTTPTIQHQLAFDLWNQSRWLRTHMLIPRVYELQTAVDR